MKIDGSCLCGYLTYEAEVDPDKVKACHCTECQTQSGAAFRTVVPAPGNAFRLLSGEPKIYVKTADSGAKRALAFCPECGSSIYGSDVGDDPKGYSIRVGTIRQRDQLAPREQIWFRSAQRWVADMAALPKRDKQ